MAQHQRLFWRRNWWQGLFLALPFLRFARTLTSLRAARIGGVLSATVPALHDAALATVTGEPLAADGALARVLEVVLAVYSVAVFATVAAALRTFFLQRADDTRFHS